MAKVIKMDDADLAICRLSIVKKEGGGLRPGKYESTRNIYNAVWHWEEHHTFPHHKLMYDRLRRPHQRKECIPVPWVSKQQIFEWVLKKQEELRETFGEYESQQAYILKHGNLNGYDGTSECEVCGAVLTGEAKTAQYAYACGEEGRKIHHLHVGNTHFCNLDCFEKYKAKYNQQLNTPKYD